MRTINEIIIHCSDTREGKDYTVEDITSWHIARGFRTIGYHYVIYRDGSIHAGRPEEEQGAHCLEGGHNRHSIGICYIGGKSADGKKYMDTRTPEQKEALLSLLRRLKARYPHARVYGHRDFAARACPCFDAATEYKQLVIALLLVFSCCLFSACRTTRRSASEQADSEVQQAVSQTATSHATDSTFDERKHRLFKGREVKKPSATWSLWLPVMLFLIAIAVAIAISIAIRKTPFLAAFRSLLRKAVA